MIPRSWRRRWSSSSIQGSHRSGGLRVPTHFRPPSRRLGTFSRRLMPTATCRHPSHTTTFCRRRPDAAGRRFDIDRHAVPQREGQHTMTSRLAGTAALVTGASSGIGAATARRLAEEGASVALVARRRDRLEALAATISGEGGTVLVVEADVTSEQQAADAVERTVADLGRLDPLVSNAGIMLLGP